MATYRYLVIDGPSVLNAAPSEVMVGVTARASTNAWQIDVVAHNRSAATQMARKAARIALGIEAPVLAELL